ncbi:GerAB/ArcD/ProY family transporter [Robertmurraya massiliosenegalensis]|uniref:GerAB/ArcD/ProY family transporter n=1 Tax=Robertmurraya massiliosenegalensis TaxID=1287657 RepID=UPI00030CBE88|nr:GerAB/ArcD/ProY family transporter [Robertmurraya massiliosenegalensis]
MNVNVPETKQISPFLVFFIIHSMQFGIGILGFQRVIAKFAGYDAWMSIILTGIGIHILLWMIYKMLNIAGGDIVSIHSYVFGNKLGKVLSSFLILYFCLLTVMVLRTYIEVVQVWMFPHLETFWFALVFLAVVVYGIFGGFRTVTGISFFGIVLPSYILVLFLFTIPYAEFDNLLPIFDHSIMDILKASRNMSLTVIGFETLLVFYPFVKNPEQSKKWGHLAILYTTFLCLYLSILTFAYFPEEQLQLNIWPTLTMWKIIMMPFVERFEYIGLANWCLIILPNASIALWCASRLAKRLFSFKIRKTVPVLAILSLIATSSLFTRTQINFLSDLVGTVGFYFTFVYIPLLFIATLIVKKVKKR